ncbi:MAG TPA: hypothetical protein VL354_11605 [Spirochaetia bacterium]|nr:hypothetical protein [Spirochaetia bacterium]
MEILKAGSVPPQLVLDCLMRGEATIPAVEIIGRFLGSREVVIGFDTNAVYAVRVGKTASEILPPVLEDLTWLNREASLVYMNFPQAVRPLAGVLLVADFFPPDFAALPSLLSFPCRLFRLIIVDNQHSPSFLFEPYPLQLAEEHTAIEEITDQEKRFFSSW